MTTSPPARRPRLAGLEVVAAVVAALVYLSSIVDAVLYRNWTQLIGYMAQTVGILLLLVFLRHRNRRAARERERLSHR